MEQSMSLEVFDAEGKNKMKLSYERIEENIGHVRISMMHLDDDRVWRGPTMELQKKVLRATRRFFNGLEVMEGE